MDADHPIRGSIFHADLHLLTDTEFGDLEARFKAEWMDDPRASFDRWRDQYSSSDELASHNDFKYNFELLRKRFSDEHTDEAFAEVLAELEQIIRQIEEEEPEPPPRTNLAVPRGQPAGPATDIFDDVDS